MTFLRWSVLGMTNLPQLATFALPTMKRKVSDVDELARAGKVGTGRDVPEGGERA